MEFFEELPGGNRIHEEPVDWHAARAELMKNPGSWGLMVENVSSSTASQLRKGQNRNFRGEDLEQFEFRVRRPADAKGRGYVNRRTDLYGRYVPAEA